MEVLGEVFLQVLAFSTGLLVLALIGMGIYMRVRRRDPFTGRDMPQPRSNFQWLYSLFTALTLFTLFVDRLVPEALVPLRITLLALGVLFFAIAMFFFVRFLRHFR